MVNTANTSAKYNWNTRLVRVNGKAWVEAHVFEEVRRIHPVYHYFYNPRSHQVSAVYTWFDDHGTEQECKKFWYWAAKEKNTHAVYRWMNGSDEDKLGYEYPDIKTSTVLKVDISLPNVLMNTSWGEFTIAKFGSRKKAVIDLSNGAEFVGIHDAYKVFWDGYRGDSAGLVMLPAEEANWKGDLLSTANSTCLHDSYIGEEPVPLTVREEMSQRDWDYALGHLFSGKEFEGIGSFAAKLGLQYIPSAGDVKVKTITGWGEATDRYTDESHGCRVPMDTKVYHHTSPLGEKIKHSYTPGSPRHASVYRLIDASASSQAWLEAEANRGLTDLLRRGAGRSRIMINLDAPVDAKIASLRILTRGRS